MNWLLPAQTLLDLLAADETPAGVWSRSADTWALRISVISVAQARAAIMQVADTGERSRLDADLSSLLAQIQADSGHAPLPFQTEHASVWQALMHEASVAGEPQINRQIYATAMYEGLTVVEENKPLTSAFQNLGVGIFTV